MWSSQSIESTVPSSVEENQRARRSEYRFFLPSLVGPIAMLAVLVFVVGCTDQERIEKLKTEAEEARDSLEQVIEKQRALRAESQQRTQDLRKANRLITDVAEQLAELSRKQEALQKVVNKAESTSDVVEATSLAPDAETVENAIQSGLADVETQLEETRAAVGRLEQQREELTTELKNFEDWTTQLKQRLNEREETVADLREDTNELTRKLNRTRETNAQLTEEKEQLESENETLRSAYVVTAEADSLAQMGIIDRPLLGFLGNTEIQKLDRSKFRQIDTKTTAIELPSDRKGVKVQSPHQHESELYTVEEDELVIREPQDFWTVSRFLVVEVER